MKKIIGLMFLLHLLFYSCNKREYSIIVKKKWFAN